jgi:putative glutamine amidotransferase
MLRDDTKRPTYGSNQAYVQAIEDAGGFSVLIPYVQSLSELDTILARLDGVILPAGADIQPFYYHEEPRPELISTNPQADELELALTRCALQKDLPILGICRGTQLLNVALGGTLYQDVQQECIQSMQHMCPDQSRSAFAHNVCLDPHSRMARLLKNTQFAVNSIHHQAVKKPGVGVQVVGWAEDNIPEAIEVEGYRFVMGLQCHPEEIYQQVPACARFFQAFVRACSSDTLAFPEEEEDLSDSAMSLALSGLAH